MIRKGDSVSGAEFSDCEKYRYSLWRTWTSGGLKGHLCAFIGLNPSTATHEIDDPTIRRCIRFCKDWGFDGYVMLNLFAFRATDPKVMKAAADPVGQFNHAVIVEWIDKVDRVVCAWGADGEHQDRGRQFGADLRFWRGDKAYHLGLTKYGQPKHPLYLRADTQPIHWPLTGSEAR